MRRSVRSLVCLPVCCSHKMLPISAAFSFRKPSPARKSLGVQRSPVPIPPSSSFVRSVNTAIPFSGDSSLIFKRVNSSNYFFPGQTWTGGWSTPIPSISFTCVTMLLVSIFPCPPKCQGKIKSVCRWLTETNKNKK